MAINPFTAGDNSFEKLDDDCRKFLVLNTLALVEHTRK
jgi:hypothetical protein